MFELKLTSPYPSFFFNDGHLFITGNFGDTVDFDPGPAIHNLFAVNGTGAYLAEYDTAGNYMDAISFSGTGNQFGIGVCTIPPNKAGVTGFFSADSIDFDPGPALHNLFVTGSNTTWSDAFVATYVYQPVGIEDYSPDGLSFNMYPNPAGDWLTLQFQKYFSRDEIKICDVTGRDIYSGHLTSEFTKLNTSHFSDGIYFIQLIRTGTEMNTATKKLIIHH